MAIACYADLLREARQQKEAQRLLFVFTRAELPDNPNDIQRERFERGEGGVLVPVLCVDKLPEELTDMAALLEESKRTGIDWDIVFVAALAGHESFPPTSDDAEATLQRMVETIQQGSIEHFLAFDRRGDVASFH
ncbi:ribonucleotide reductase subunit alpha [Pistricoccus aurantiacus]|uniref:Ribonucleotide reductase subunit alpha n=1 Tax=Pistricoccus aurantiacus TaxID=1883414 RepID=A0A5B8SWD4_9GAMM|nr:ribonucleotide reductase subunit alpha [Pistricoccus aurantiacus]QEA39243.1 ribonucleotide reductase subunit alpha [Pistricoccus aurantiacus]